MTRLWQTAETESGSPHRVLSNIPRTFGQRVASPDREGRDNKVNLKRDEYEYQAKLRMMATYLFDVDRWLEIMGEHEDKWKEIQAEVDKCNRELEKIE